MRLPQDSNGRLKGFGYAEFVDKESLVAALTLNNEVIFFQLLCKDRPNMEVLEIGAQRLMFSLTLRKIY